MIDIHMHVIPGVDDGSRTMEESLDLLRCAQSQGITSVIATSHSAAFDHGRSNRVFAQLKRLQHAAEKEGIAVDLYPGAEILCFRHNVDDAIAKLQRGTYPTLNRTRYMLLEFFPDECEEDACYCIDRILQAGYHPVLAHAERCDFVNEQSVKILRAAGVTVQINVYSVFEEHSAPIRSRAHMLLRNRLVDFTGSDAHRIDHRPPSCVKGIDYLYRTCDRDYVDRILTGNAGRLLCRNHHSVPN